MSVAVATVLDVTVVLALALAATTALRRRSASARHAVLAAGLLAAAAAPALEMLLPAWELPIAWGARAEEVSSTTTWASGPAIDDRGVWTRVAAGPSFSWLEAIGLAWLAGSLVVLGGLVVSLVRLARETRRCTIVRSGPWRDLADRQSAGAVTLLQSDSPKLLLTWGHLRPAILLPAGAGAWSPDRRAVVLAHELAHIRRGDWALQLGAECLRAVYWFHPLVWIACRRLRHESECACDDAVLEAGVEPTDYAAHLLDVARQAIARRDRWASAPAVAHPSTLERRIAAMLHHTGDRTSLTRRARACVAAAAIVMAAPIAAVAITERTEELAPTTVGADVTLAAPPPSATSAPPPSAATALPPPSATTATPAAQPGRAGERARAAAPAVLAQQSPGSVSGVLTDASGGVMPGVSLTLTGTQSGAVRWLWSDGNGSFAFRDLPPGPYALVAELPGFATVRTELELGPDEQLQRRLSMSLGSVQETITVLCRPGAAALLPRPGGVMASPGRTTARAWPLFLAPQDAPRVQDEPAAPRAPVRVGGNVRAPQKLRHVNPLCPPPLPPPPDGTVAIFEAVLGPDGNVQDIKVLRQPSPAGLADSATDAIRQWEFTPTLLNNVPVPVIMTVTVLFQRE